MKRFYGLLSILTLILIVGQPIYAQSQTVDNRVVVDKSILTPDQLAKLQADALTNQVVEQVSTYSKIAGVGKEVGIAVREGLTAVVDIADKFGGTDVGKFTMVMIAW